MKKFKVVVLILLILFSNFSTVYADDRFYSCDRLNISITLLDDGSALFEEDWTMSYKGGKFTKFIRNIPLDRNYNITDLKVSENNKDYIKLEQLDQNKPEGCYAVEISNDEMYFEIYYGAENESKTFHISYILNNAVLLYDDVAEFYWKIIGDEWDIPLNNVSVNIKIPTGASKEDIRVWAHGPLSGIIDIESTETVTMKVDMVDEYTFVEARIVMPKLLFTNCINTINGSALDNILKEEGKFAEDANRQREISKVRDFLLLLPFLLIIVTAITMFIVLKKATKRYEATFNPEYYRDITKTDLTPAEVVDIISYYKFSSYDDRRFTSTLLDLNLKGYININKDDNALDNENLIITIDDSKDVDELKKHEQKLLSFLKKVASNKVDITQNDIRKYIEKHKSSVSKLFTSFKKLSLKELDRKGYIDHSLDKYINFYMAIIGLSSVATVISFRFKNLVIIFLLAILCVFAVFCLCRLKRLTQLGEDELALWEGYRNFLKDFTSFNEKELPEIILWEKYIVYAVAVGQGRQILKDLPIMYSNLNEDLYYRDNHLYNLYLMYNIENGEAVFNNNIFSSINSISDSIKGAFSSTSSSSSSGSGGGFSSGGGGGGGGGGGRCS